MMVYEYCTVRLNVLLACDVQVNIDFEPFKPINTSLYLCDNKFHTEVRYIDLYRQF